jgi:adenosylhomocysteine nucleosidase
MHHNLPNPLVVIALEQETCGLFDRAEVPVLYTGVGKINATFQLTKALASYPATERSQLLVINFGTAGSNRFRQGECVACDTFIQRDMDAESLGFEKYTTPFDPTPAVLKFPPLLGRLPRGVCGTGDSFCTADSRTDVDVFDMEAYALAKVCWLYGATFASVKYISDGADASAPDAWRDSLRRAAEAFVAVYDEITRRP